MKTYRLNAVMAGALYILGSVFGILGGVFGGELITALITSKSLAGMDLLNTLAGCDHLLICDAVRTGGPPGSMVKLAGDQVPALFQTRYSPHQLGLSDLLATLTLTGEAPATVTLVGIIPADLGLGLELSPAVAGVVGQAVECLAAELRGLGYPLELKLQTLPS